MLFGAANPGGKLSLSWPRTAGRSRSTTTTTAPTTPEDAPDFTSRYWDIESKPLYPFGYGLSYTTFRFGHLKVTSGRIAPDGRAEVRVDVTNTGNVAGDEVAELYIHRRAGSASRQARQLEGFQRIALAPGETKKLTRLPPTIAVRKRWQLSNHRILLSCDAQHRWTHNRTMQT